MRAVLPTLAAVVGLSVPVSGWEPGDTTATTGFSVDTGRRSDVVAFWHGIYADSDGYAERIGWTGNYANCTAGTTAREFQDDVQRRINFLRALAGLPGDALVNDGTTVYVDAGYNPPAGTLRSTAAQQAAHMIARSAVVSHTPSPGLTCFTSAAGNACLRGSLAYAFFGPGAIDQYMRETSAAGDTVWSATAGHRRWILYPGATVFATGDTPGGSGKAATNVLYCVPTQGELAPVPARFTAWPAAGYFPDELNSLLWSLSRPGANFSQAQVSMTGPGGAVGVTIVDRTNTTYGDPAIVWQVPAAVGAQSVAADTVYQVVVTGIQGSGVPTSHNYRVIVINPDALVEPLELTGSAAPPASGARYAFQKVDLADDHVVDVSRLVAAAWTEGAEASPAPRVVDGTSEAYELLAHESYAGRNFWRTGSNAFRLAFPYLVNPPAEDSFGLAMELATGPASSLSLYYMRGRSTSSRLIIETTVDGGVSWQQAGTPIQGRTDYVTDTSFTAKSVALPANQPSVRVRFRHEWLGGAFYHVGSSGYPEGIFIDDITVSGTQELQSVNTVSLGAGASTFWFDAVSAGRPLVAGDSYKLRLQASIEGHEFPFGPVREVTVDGTPLSGFEAWKEYEQPLLAGGFDDDDDGDGMGNGAEYAFGTDPMDRSGAVDTLVVDRAAGLLRLSRSLDRQRAGVGYGAEWSADMVTWTTSGVSVSFTGGQLTAGMAMAGSRRFLRWRITQM